MTANNETGVIQPMAEISARCRKHGVLLHSDMVQSFGKVIPSESRDPWSEREAPLQRTLRSRRGIPRLRCALLGMTAWRWSMPPVSVPTNSTDQKAPAFFISARVYRSIASNSADPTKANAGRGPRMFQRSSGWRRPPRKRCGICLTNRNARPACGMSCGGASNTFSPQLN